MRWQLSATIVKVSLHKLLLAPQKTDSMFNVCSLIDIVEQKILWFVTGYGYGYIYFAIKIILQIC